MKKHSHATFAAVTFSKENKKLTINYADNGIGAEKDRIKLSSVENRMEALRGNLTFDTKLNEGFKVRIELPI